MSLRSDAVRLTGAAGPVRPRLLPGLGPLAVALVSGILAACGGGGGGDPTQLVVKTTTVGAVPLAASGLYGGPATFEVRRSDNSLVQAVSVDRSGSSEFVVNAPSRTALQLVLTQHPRNQLCTVSTPGLQIGQAQGSATITCLPAILNDTGVTSCATPDRPALCAAQDFGSGRDAEVARLNRVTTDTTLASTAFDYTRICNSGVADGQGSGCQLGASPSPGAIGSQWGCTRDNVTGLVWIIREGPAVAYTESNIPISRPSNLTFACGRDDWSLPTASELSSLIHSGRSAGEPAVNPAYFPNLIEPNKQRFWTASQVKGANRVFVDFALSGSVNAGAAPNAELYVAWVSRVQAVRPPDYSEATRFSASPDGAIITDRLTGLAWSVCSLGRGTGSSPAAPCTGQASGYSWEGALDAAKTANDTRRGGYGDWRLPSRAELGSLLDYTVQTGVLLSGLTPQALRDDSVDSGGQGTSYWTSTAAPGPTLSCGSRVRPYQVNFGEGGVSAFQEDCPGDEFELKLRVRLVRDAR